MSHHPKGKAPFPDRINSRTFSGLSVLALVVIQALIIILGLVYYRYLETQSRLDVEKELQALATLKLDQLTHWREERLKDAVLVRENPFVQTHVRELIDAPDSPEAARLKAWLKTMLSHHGYYQLAVLRNDGSWAATIHTELRKNDGEPQPGVHEEHTEWIQRVRDSKGPVLTDIHFDQNEMPHIGTIISIPAAQEDSSPVAFFVMYYDLDRFFYPLLESWPTPSRTAETLLVRKEGEDVLFLNNLRHHPNSALTFRIPLSRTHLPAGRAITGTTGPTEGLDYRGEKVFSVVWPVPDSNWFMVAKIDKKEALSGWLSVSKNILFLLCVLLLASTAVFYSLWNRRRRLQYRALYLQSEATRKIEARHRVVLMSIGDAVITTDINGDILFMNPVAEILTGWSAESAIGKHLPDVFKIINETTREPVANPVELVLSKMGIVGLANHTVLIARDGKEWPIADSGSPVFDDHGELMGVVLVFRDQTEEIEARKALTVSNDRFHKAVDLSPFPAMIHDEDSRVILINQEWQKLSGFTIDDIPTIGDWTEKAYGKLHTEVKEYIDGLYTQTGRVDEGNFTVTCKDGSSRIWSFASVPLGKDPEGKQTVMSMAVDITEQEKMKDLLMQAEKLESVGKLAGGVAHDFNNMLMGTMNYVDLCLEEVDADSPVREWLEEINQISERSAGITRQLLTFARKQTVTPQVLHVDKTVPHMINMLKRLIGENIELTWEPAPGLWPAFIDAAQFDQIVTNLAVNARDAISGVGNIRLSAQNITLDEVFCQQHVNASPGDYVVLSVSDTGSGMDDETRKHAFDPFYTSKAIGKGTGLGLATVFGIVEQNKGFIHLQSELGRGTTFDIYLPRHIEVLNESSLAKDDRGQLNKGKETILLTEDEPSVRTTLEFYLSARGYQVLSAEHPEEGFSVAKASEGTIDLLVTDMIMPGMNGRDYANALLKDFPDLKILFISGYTEDFLAQEEVSDREVHFLSKPFTGRTLEKKVREILDGD